MERTLPVGQTHRTNKFGLIFFLLLVFSHVHGQVSFNGDLTTRFGDSKNGFNYSESIINTFLNWNQFQTWVQYEYSQPPELGSRFNGFRKFRLEFNNGPLGIRLGDLYEIWGRGLVLNQFDDQLIDLDNGIRGAALDYTLGNMEAKILNGNGVLSRRSVEVAGFNDRTSNYSSRHQVFGSDLSFSGDHYSVGTSFLQSRENHLLGIFLDDSVSLVHRIRAIRGEMLLPWMDAYVEYADKTVHELDLYSQEPSRVNQGYGLYGNINGYLGNWALSFDYKNYRFVELDPFYRWSTITHYGGVVDFQNPPTVFREHTSILLSRLTHQIDFNDELGYQLEVNGSLPGGATLLLNVAQSSRHSEWITIMDGFPFGWTSKPIQSLLPSDQPAAYPFRELYTEIEGYALQDRIHYRFGYGWMEDISGLFMNVEGDTSQLIYEYKQALTIPTMFSWDFGKQFSVEVKMEFQTLWQGSVTVTDTLGKVTRTTSSVFYKAEQVRAPYQHNRFFDLSISRSPRWSVSLLIDAVDAEEPPFQVSAENALEKLMANIMDIDRKWIALEMVVNLSPRNRLTLMYGSQKGGLVCSNGVCRYVGAFDDGFKLTLTSIF